MARARVEIGLRVVFWTLVFVPHEQANGRAERDTMLDS